jgi:glycosyltransferase 2 family protein
VEKKTKKILEYIFRFVILGTLFYVLFRKVGVTTALETFYEINLFWILLFFVIYFLTKILVTWNISILLLALGKKIKFKTLFSYQLLTAAVALFLPGGTGEVSLTMLLHKRKGMEYGEGLSIQLIDKLVTSIFFAFFAVYGLLFVFELSEIYLYLVFGVILLFLLIVLFVWSNKLRRIIRKYILRKYSKYFRSFSKTFKYILRHKKKYLVLNLFVTALLMFFIFLGGSLVFKAFGFTIPLLHIAFIHSIITIIGYLPLPLSGLGVKELSAIYLFSLVGVPLSIITAYLLFNVVFKYVFFTGVYFYLGRLFYR